MLNFNIRKQVLTRTDKVTPVEKSINYLKASFSFLTKDWDGFEKRAICKNYQSGKEYEVPIIDGVCTLPWEALDKKGSFEISVRGTKDDVVITTSVVLVELDRTLAGGAESNPPTPTEVELLWQHINMGKDYSQNNPDAADYIKNRPFWSEVIAAHDVLPKTILTESDGSAYTIVNEFSVTEGDEYKVTWNSEEYKCAVKTFVENNEKIVYLGNLSAANPDLFEDTGEPFGIIITPAGLIEQYGFYAMVYPWDDSVNPTITISAGRKEVVHKLKNKFLPLDWLPTYNAEEQLAAEKIVTNGMGIPTDTKNGFPDMTMEDVAHGDKLAVYLDGERYECEVIVSKNDGSDDDVIAGNIGFIYGEPGVPFCLIFANSRTGIMCANGEHVASVYKLVPNKLPEYFLPDDLIDDEMLAQAVEEYLKENPIDSGATEEEAAQIEQNKEDIESLKLNKLDSSKLPEAIKTALAEAKASGAFDGADGKDGTNGKDGVDGTTPHIGDNGNWWIGDTDTGTAAGGSGGGGNAWKLVASGETTEETTRISVSTDINGNTFSLNNALFLLTVQAVENNGTLVYVPNGKWSGVYYGNSKKGVPNSYKTTYALEMYADENIFIATELHPDSGGNIASFGTDAGLSVDASMQKITKMDVAIQNSKFATGAKYALFTKG